MPCRMSVANVLAGSVVVESRGGAAAGHELDVFLERAGVELMPVTVEHLAASRRAWCRFGKGNHSAALNFGDCFAYALAKVLDEPLLFKGRDFVRTDSRPHDQQERVGKRKRRWLVEKTHFGVGNPY